MTKIIAELSGNHGGDADKIKEMVLVAKWAGCYAVKLQLYAKGDLPDFDPKLNFPTNGLLSYFLGSAKRAGIKTVVSVFALWAVEHLAVSYKHFPLHAYKLASPESTRLKPEAYRRIAKYIRHYDGRLWVASGHADMEFMRSLNPDLLFYCPPGHPAILDEKDLGYRAYSDHTAGIISTLAMIQSGAKYIEKHFKLDDDCVDADFSINPDQMKILCDLAS